jgi:hypothetical protein
LLFLTIFFACAGIKKTFEAGQPPPDDTEEADIAANDAGFHATVLAFHLISEFRPCGGLDRLQHPLYKMYYVIYESKIS